MQFATYPAMKFATYPAMQFAIYPKIALEPTQECSLEPTQECGGWDDACSLGHHDGDARLQEGDGEVHVLLPLPTDLQHQKGYYHIREYKVSVYR